MEVGFFFPKCFLGLSEGGLGFGLKVRSDVL